jgi:hypothetical protein
MFTDMSLLQSSPVSCSNVFFLRWGGIGDRKRRREGEFELCSLTCCDRHGASPYDGAGARTTLDLTHVRNSSCRMA